MKTQSKILLFPSREPDFQDLFCLTFEISQEVFGSVRVTPIKPGGSEIPVTQENKVEFVESYINYALNTSVQKQFDAFKIGFEKVCGGTLISLFHAQELQAMVRKDTDPT